MQRLFVQLFLLIAAMLAAAWLLVPGASPRKDALALQTGEASAAAAPATAAFYGNETVIPRDASGQFRVTASVNGQDVPFLVDTGADVVALTWEDAQRIGLDVAPDSLQPIMQTASGVGYGAPVSLDDVELGGTDFHDVAGVVVKGLQVNLLGQSLLRRLGKVELRGDRMVIRQP